MIVCDGLISTWIMHKIYSILNSRGNYFILQNVVFTAPRK